MSLSGTTPARVTVTIMRRLLVEVALAKSALGGAVRLVTQHQAVSERLITRALGTGKPLGEWADFSSSVVLGNVPGTQLTVSELITYAMPVSNRHIMKFGAYG